MTPEQFRREIRAAAEAGEWISAERMCRTQAWCMVWQAVRRGFAAMAARLRSPAHRLASGGTRGTRRV